MLALYTSKHILKSKFKLCKFIITAHYMSLLNLPERFNLWIYFKIYKKKIHRFKIFNTIL